MNTKSFRINEIFYSLQGEGFNTGRAAVFIRFAGCNLRCPFCDTEFDSYSEMTSSEIVEAIRQYPARFAVLTGGEPTLQVDEDFVALLHDHGYTVAMESNGTRPAPRNLDWLTVSPKSRPVSLDGKTPDELKIVFDESTDPEAQLSTLNSQLSALNSQLSTLNSQLSTLNSPLLFLQPCDTGNAERNAQILKQCIGYIEQHPQWRLSLQTHKLTGIK